MKKLLTVPALALLLTIILISCASMKRNKDGQTYRYVYEGSPLYQVKEGEKIGDSINVVDKTELLPMTYYLEEFWGSGKFWKIEYDEDFYFVDMNNTGWEKIEKSKEDSSLGKLIVKTVILEGVHAGDEEVKMEIHVLDSNVNHKRVDYAPTISPDGKILIFVSNRPGSKTNEDNELTHDFWAVEKENKYDTKFGEIYNVDPADKKGWNGINTTYNEGVATIAADGRSLFFTGCERPDGLGSCDIYMSKIFEGEWSKPINLGADLNSQQWDAQPSVSPDMKRLYFTSNRTGPHGESNYDIWYSDWDEENEMWKPAMNLTAVNTPGKECAPFIGADNITLFFSSNGYKEGKEDLDFYVTRYDRETRNWSDPAPLSDHLNTEYDEEFLTLPASGDIIYFSSERQDIPGSSGGLDLYMAFVKSFFRAIVIKVYVADDSEDEIPTFVKVDNTVSQRLVKEKLSGKDNVLGMVLTNADYGQVQDSLPYIDLNITASNKEHGDKTKTLRVKNPLMTQDKSGWVFTDEIDVTFDVAMSPELEEYLNKMGRTILDASVSASGYQDDKEVDARKITVEEFQSTKMQPLLNYIFFDENSHELPPRYHQLSKEQSAAFQIGAIKDLDAVENYHHILNIIGRRMNDIPDAKITLVGCNSDMGEELNRTELSKNRAITVADYLVDTWGITRDRIGIQVRNLPVAPSNNRTSEGEAENRRVEIHSDDNELLSPVITKEKLYVANPSLLIFKGMVSVHGGDAEWTFTAKQDDDTLKIFKGEGAHDGNLVWEINKEKHSIPKKESPLLFELEVKEKEKDKFIVAKGQLEVEQITSSKKLSEKNTDKRIDRFSLILFDYGESDLSDRNKEIISLIKEYIEDNSKIKIYGYSDKLGDDRYNKKLSRKRADQTADILGGSYSVVHGFGESVLLYDNELPEGRFYCRTVEVIVETPIGGPGGVIEVGE